MKVNNKHHENTNSGMKINNKLGAYKTNMLSGSNNNSSNKLRESGESQKRTKLLQLYSNQEDMDE